MRDASARNTDRIEAAKWLGDRGFGRSIQGLDIGVSAGLALDIKSFSTDDLQAMVAILDKYEPTVGEVAQSGQIPFAIG